MEPEDGREEENIRGKEGGRDRWRQGQEKGRGKEYGRDKYRQARGDKEDRRRER